MDKIHSYQRFTSIFIICFAHFYTVASDVGENRMILDTKNYCDALNILHESSYLAKCSEIPFPKDFKENDVDLALCMMVLDTMNKICQTIVNKDYKPKLPETAKELDNNVKKFEPDPKDYDTFISNLCKKIIVAFNSWNDPDVQSDPSTVPYIKYLSETLLEKRECGYTCHSPNGTVNPLCMIFLWFNKLSSTMKKIKSLVPDSNKNGENSVVFNDPVSQKELSTLANVKNVYSNGKQKIEEHTSPINKVDLKHASEDNLLPNGYKISEYSSVHNEDEPKKESEINKSDDRRKDEATLPLSGNDKTNIVTYKPSGNSLKNSNNVPQPEEGNPDKVLNSSEDRQNKKISDNKFEEGDERDNINDIKESISNTEDELLLSRNADVQQGLFQDSKKTYSHTMVVPDVDESHFFRYFSVISLICIGLYIVYHNKQKILAMALEGRRTRRGRGSRRRPSTASYHKLDCNLEEAVTSQCNSNVTHVIY